MRRSCGVGDVEINCPQSLYILVVTCVSQQLGFLPCLERDASNGEKNCSFPTVSSFFPRDSTDQRFARLFVVAWKKNTIRRLYRVIFDKVSRIDYAGIQLKYSSGVPSSLITFKRLCFQEKQIPTALLSPGKVQPRFLTCTACLAFFYLFRVFEYQNKVCKKELAYFINHHSIHRNRLLLRKVSSQLRQSKFLTVRNRLNQTTRLTFFLSTLSIIQL